MNDAAGEIERGRNAYCSRAWSDAYEAFSHADRMAGLQADDLSALATSAYMLGRDEDYVRALERAYRLYRDADEPSRPSAARSGSGSRGCCEERRGAPEDGWVAHCA